MNHLICTCGAVFTESPIISLLEHREREHCPTAAPAREHPLRAGVRAGSAPRGGNRDCIVNWLTPDELDRERLRWRRWKPQRGGWNQGLWVEVQDEWRRAL